MPIPNLKEVQETIVDDAQGIEWVQALSLCYAIIAGVIFVTAMTFFRDAWSVALLIPVAITAWSAWNNDGFKAVGVNLATTVAYLVIGGTLAMPFSAELDQAISFGIVCIIPCVGWAIHSTRIDSARLEAIGIAFIYSTVLIATGLTILITLNLNLYWFCALGVSLVLLWDWRREIQKEIEKS